MKKFLSTVKGKIIVGVIALAVIVCAVVAVLLLTNKGHRSIKVDELSGQTIISSGEAEGQDAYEGMLLKSGQNVSVQEEANMTLLLDMDKYVFADAGTKFSIEAVGSEKKETAKTKIVLEEGSALFRLDEKLAEGESFTVETPNATMSVRGTVFVVSVHKEEDGKTYTKVEVVEGSVFVEANTEDGKKAEDETTVNGGASIVIYSDDTTSEFVEDGDTIVSIEYSGDMSLYIEDTMSERKKSKRNILSEYWFEEEDERYAKVKSIEFLDSLETMPAEGAIDVTLKQDNSVMLWMVDKGDYYEVYIGADGKVIAPESGLRLFDTSVYDAEIGEDVSLTPMLERIEFNNAFDTSQMTSMQGMFAYSPVTSLDLSSFDTSNVTDMSFMFHFCENLTELNVSSFDTSNVTDMMGVFYACRSLSEIDISVFDTSNVTTMDHMFGMCPGLSHLDLSCFDTSNVTSMNSMFFACVNLTDLNVSSFNTANVTDMSDMFHNCPQLTSLDVSGFNTSKVTDMSGMFTWCENLENIDISGFDMSNVTDTDDMFYGTKYEYEYEY